MVDILEMVESGYSWTWCVVMIRWSPGIHSERSFMVESRYSWTWHIHDTVESGYTVKFWSVEKRLYQHGARVNPGSRQKERESPKLRQLNTKLSQPRKQTQGERVAKAQAAKRQLEFHNTPIRLNCSQNTSASLYIITQCGVCLHRRLLVIACIVR